MEKRGNGKEGLVRLQGLARNSTRHPNSRSFQVVANKGRKMAFTDNPHWIGHDASRGLQNNIDRDDLDRGSICMMIFFVLFLSLLI